MVISCSAYNCTNRQRRDNVSFYRFPKDPPERKQAWVAAMKRSDWTPTEHSRLCSAHFISGKRSENPRSPDYVPSIFWYVTPAKRERQKARLATFERWRNRLRYKQELVNRAEAAKGLLSLLPNTRSQATQDPAGKPTIGCTLDVRAGIQFKTESPDPESQIEQRKAVKDQTERIDGLASIRSETNAGINGKPTNGYGRNVLSSTQLKVEESALECEMKLDQPDTEFQPKLEQPDPEFQLKLEQPDPEFLTEEGLKWFTPLQGSESRPIRTENTGLNEQIRSPSLERNSFEQGLDMLNYTGQPQFTLLFAPSTTNQANAESVGKQTLGCGPNVLFPVQLRAEQAESLSETEQELKSFKAECQALRTENLALKEHIKMTSLNEESFSEDQKKLKYYTGLGDYSVFMDMLNLLSPNLRDHSSLSKFQQLLVTLMRLRLNLTIQDLGYRFGINKSTVSRTFRNIVNLMHSQLASIAEIWPDATNIILENIKMIKLPSKPELPCN